MSPLSLVLLFAASVIAGGPGYPTPHRELGPSILEDCLCTDFVTKMQECQRNDPLQFDANEACMCSDYWYGSSMYCRDCIQSASKPYGITDEERQFYSGFTQAITNIFVACTNAGASVTVNNVDADHTNGKLGVCGWNTVGLACFGVEDGMAWSSEIDRDTKETIEASSKYAGLAVPTSASSKASKTLSSSSTPVSTAEVDEPVFTSEAAEPTVSSAAAFSSSAAASSSAKSTVSAAVSSSESAEPSTSTAAASSSSSESAVPSADPNAANGLNQGLGSSLALVAVMVVLVAAF